MKHRYSYGEAGSTGKPPGIELYDHVSAENFERASVGTVERVKHPASGRVHLVLKGGGDLLLRRRKERGDPHR